MLNWTISFSFADGYFQRVCEGGHLSINCGSKVTVIKSASYGRTQKGVCAPGGLDSNIFCYSASSMRVTLHRCQGQHRCTVHATNSAFGDPCVGTVKYLEVCLGFNTLYFLIKMYFIRISRLIFANQESFKNRTEAEVLKRIKVCVLKICKYNKILCFQLIRKKLCCPSTVKHSHAYKTMKR